MIRKENHRTNFRMNSFYSQEAFTWKLLTVAHRKWITYHWLQLTTVVFFWIFSATITFSHVITLTSFCLYIQLGVSYLWVRRTLNLTQWAHLKEETPPDATLLLLLPFISSSTQQQHSSVTGTSPQQQTHTLTLSLKATMKFCFATFAACLFLFGVASCAPTGHHQRDSCADVKTSSLALNRIAKIVSTEVRDF